MANGLEALLEQWQEFMLIQRGLRARGVARYASTVRGFFAWRQSLDVTTITRAEVERWQKALYLELGNLSNRSRASKLSALRNFCRWLLYTNTIKADPTEGIPSPKALRLLPSKFSKDELRRLFAAPDLETRQGVRDLAILKTLYASGLRVSELVALDVGHLIDTGGYIRIQVIDGKGGKGRTLTLRSNPSTTLRRWLTIRSGIESESAAVFVRLRGSVGRLSEVSIQNILKKHAATAGIDPTTAHCHKLRATFASDLYDSGHDHCPRCGHAIQYVGVLEVGAQLGHDDVKTTMGYIAISDRVLKKTAIPDRRFREIEREED